MGVRRQATTDGIENNDNADNNDNSNTSNNNNGGTSMSGSNTTSQWSALPSGCTVNNLRTTIPGCQFLDENDGSLQYSDGWIFSTSDPNGLIHTVHFTQIRNSSVSLTFNATSIVIFGLVPSGSSPPQASYSIDGSIRASSHTATTDQCVPNQEMFNSGNLTAGIHNLTIKVTTASQDQPYILDYLWLCPSGAQGAQITSDASESTAPTKAHTTTSKDTILFIAVAVLGLVVLVLVIMLGILLHIRRKSGRKESGSEKQTQRPKSTTSTFSGSEVDSQDTVTQIQVTSLSTPVEPLEMSQADVPVDESSLEEGTASWRTSNIANNGDLASARDGDRPSSSLVPAPSPRSTVLARRLEKAMRFRPPITFRRSSPSSHGNYTTGRNGVRRKDEPPPPYAIT